MDKLNVKKIVIILLYALVGWALCGAIIGIGFGVTSVENTLVIHAVGVPIIFGLISWLYFTKFNYTTPWQTAAIFLAFAFLMDFFVIAMLAQKSFDMFASILGTWIPFALIFGSTYLVGTFLKRSQTTIVA